MQNENLNKDNDIENLNYIDKWNNGLLEQEEYQKIVEECLELID